MFSKFSFLFVAFNVFVFCDSAYVDTLSKCQLNDKKCTKSLLQKVLKDIGETGVPEIELPPIDPIQLKNVTIKVLDLIEFSLLDGIVKGVKDCDIDRFDINIDDGRSLVELTCDVTIKGKYKMYSSSPLLKTLLSGETLRGDGNGKVKIEKVNLKFNFLFIVEKRNEEIYVKCITNETKYDYDVKGKMTFFADKLYVGEQESSKLVLGLLNQNWKFLMSSFGKPFMDKAVDFVHEFVEKFIDSVPAKYYILDDLSSHLT